MSFSPAWFDSCRRSRATNFMSNGQMQCTHLTFPSGILHSLTRIETDRAIRWSLSLSSCDVTDDSHSNYAAIEDHAVSSSIQTSDDHGICVVSSGTRLTRSPVSGHHALARLQYPPQTRFWIGRADMFIGQMRRNFTGERPSLFSPISLTD